MAPSILRQYIIILWGVFTVTVAGINTSWASGRDSLNIPFTVRISSGHSEPVFNTGAEISFDVNNFGVAELGFRGVVGVQVEPTSAYRHRSLNNIARGDIFFVKCTDSTFYRGEILALQPASVEIKFVPIATDFASGTGEIGKSFPRTFTVLAGAAFPVGWFSAVYYDDVRSGYAVTGLSVGIEYMHGVAEHFDVGACGVYSHIPIDHTILTAQLIQHGGSDASMNAWDLLWFMPEAGFRTKILPVMDIYIRGMGGIMGGYAPEITESLSDGRKLTVKSGSTITLSYGISLGVIESNRVNVSIRFMGAEGNYSKINNVSHFATHTIQFMAGYVF